VTYNIVVCAAVGYVGFGLAFMETWGQPGIHFIRGALNISQIFSYIVHDKGYDRLQALILVKVSWLKSLCDIVRMLGSSEGEKRNEGELETHCGGEHYTDMCDKECLEKV
jgi:hypothetical protein